MICNQTINTMGNSSVDESDNDNGVGSHPQPQQHHHSNESILQIAANVCLAAGRGDTATANSFLLDFHVQSFLEIFETLIGYRADGYYIAGSDIPLNVKAHLLLRAFLQFPHPSIPW